MNFKSKAIILDERIAGGREAADVSWHGSLLTYKIANPQAEGGNTSAAQTIDLSQASFQIGGNRNAFLFIRHPSLEPGQIYVEQTSEFRRFATTHPILRDRLASSLRSYRSPRRTAIVSLIAIAVVFIALFLGRSHIANGLVSLIPFSTEKKIADLIHSRKAPTSPEADAANQKLRLLIEPLLKAHPQWRDKLTFHLSSDKDANAYATIGGHIFINRGLVELLETPEQLLGVIAHETAHANGRHVSRSILQGAGLFLIVQTLIGDVTGIVAVLADQGAPLLMLQHSRELEVEADRMAAKDLIESNINAKGLVEALKKIDEQTKRLMSEMPGGEVNKVLSKLEIWSTHPDMDRRIRELESYIAELMEQRAPIAPLSFDYDALVESVRNGY